MSNYDFLFPIEDNMSVEQIDNLKEIFELGYGNICLSYSDAEQILRIPEIKKYFYPIYRNYVGKVGFMTKNNKSILVWHSYSISKCGIKIGLLDYPQDVYGSDNSWSEELSFKDKEAMNYLKKFMKMKAFW